MTEEEERFVHLVSCIRDLNSAWRLLNEIKRSKERTPLVGAAFQFALIEYSKPYRSSHGFALDSKGKQLRYKLDERHVPEQFRPLHQNILKRRDQIHAHSDLTIREAKLFVAQAPGRKIATIVQNKFHGTEEFRRLDEIVSLIEGTLDSLYNEEKQLEAQLPTT